MVDEAHERSLTTDVLLGVLKKIKKRRAELRIIVSSATLQANAFAAFFSSQVSEGETSNECQIVSLEGRTFPVDSMFLEQPSEDYVEQAVATVFAVHADEPEGDMLVFLTGREEIERALQLIADRIPRLHSQAPSILGLPLYAGLTSEQQLYVFEPAPQRTRKVILATNVAEASVTIDGIVYVIDPGFVKLRVYDPHTAMEVLTAVPISKASAIQRAGRAGRTKPGKCYRLYTQQAYENLPDVTVPEIQRSNLAPMILQLKALGIDNVLRFDFLTPPPADLMARALELLFSLGALDEYAKLTRPLGVRMAELSVEPMMAKVLLSAPSMGCLSEVLTIAAMTSLQGAVWFQPDGERKPAETARRRFAADEGDHLTLLNVYQSFVTRGKKEPRWCKENFLNYKSMARAVSIRSQLKRYLERFGIDVNESLPSGARALDIPDKGVLVRKALTAGYFAHAARMQADGTFKIVNGAVTLYAHPTSLMFVSDPFITLGARTDLPSEPESRLGDISRALRDKREGLYP